MMAEKSRFFYFFFISAILEIGKKGIRTHGHTEVTILNHLNYKLLLKTEYYNSNICDNIMFNTNKHNAIGNLVKQKVNTK